MTEPDARRQAIDGFAHRYGASPEFIVRAPGRVNLIGEHTDYNGGLVLPLAIDRGLWLAGRARPDGQVQLDSLNLAGSVVFQPGEPRPAHDDWPSWGDYAWGVADELARADPGTPRASMRPGIEAVIATDLPVGAGLSSSAALELGVARALIEARRSPWEAHAMSLLCHRAERSAVGVACGVMDQLIVGTAAPDSALLIDCRSQDTQPVALPADLAVAVLDTGTRRELSDSAYNDRRAECEAAAAALDVACLSDVSPEQLSASHLTDVPLRRARHVVTENRRVHAFVRALEANDRPTMGALMSSSHASLADDFDVVTPALDAIVEAARASPGCIAARMTGAGFGGCAVALIERALAAAFAASIAAEYALRSEHVGQIHLCRPAAGVSVKAVP